MKKNGSISDEREKYAKDKNVANAIPMVVHGGFKIMSDMEHILKYLEGTFPGVKTRMFEHIAEGKFEKIVKWHKTMLKPRCDSLIALQFSSTLNEDE